MSESFVYLWGKQYSSLLSTKPNVIFQANGLAWNEINNAFTDLQIMQMLHCSVRTPSLLISRAN